MNIPLNGRIAIIDDKVEQALPLMSVLAQKKCPYVHFTGDVRYLPEEGASYNDIRILFLDINLIDDSVRSAKELRGILVSVLQRVISASNFPWVLIYWSRHEEEHAKLVDEIFDRALADRKPIVRLSQRKSDFFSLYGQPTPEFEDNMMRLFDQIADVLAPHSAYRQLIGWENLLHQASDRTLQDIFNSVHEHASWADNAAFLLEKLGESFAGRKWYGKQDASEKVRSAFQALGGLLTDTVEYAVNNAPIEAPAELTYDHSPEAAERRASSATRENICKVNKKLLLSDDRTNPLYSGMVIKDEDSASNAMFKEMLNECLNRTRVSEELPAEDRIKKKIDSSCSKIRERIRESWMRLHLVVTPLCDFVQNKPGFARVVAGFLIAEDLVGYIDARSEAVFMSPRFLLEGRVYVLVLHFRYLYGVKDETGLIRAGLAPAFRVRQGLLAEIQSRLARHVSRQGVLFVE